MAKITDLPQEILVKVIIEHIATLQVTDETSNFDPLRVCRSFRDASITAFHSPSSKLALNAMILEAYDEIHSNGKLYAILEQEGDWKKRREIAEQLRAEWNRDIHMFD